MNKTLQQYADRFNAQSLRERGLIAITIIVGVVFLWWSYHASPLMMQIDKRVEDNQRLASEVENTRVVIDSIRKRIAAGVHREKEDQLARLIEDLAEVEERLRLTTIELVDPEKMFRLMNELIYRDSKLKLISLKRREVRSAIPPADPERDSSDATIYRHVLEMQFSGRYLDILAYMQAMEALDWKLLWDEIDIVSEAYPKLTVKVVMSTLSTGKEWVGI